MNKQAASSYSIFKQFLLRCVLGPPERKKLSATRTPWLSGQLQASRCALAGGVIGLHFFLGVVTWDCFQACRLPAFCFWEASHLSI
jgi:hypothetical protein